MVLASPGKPLAIEADSRTFARSLVPHTNGRTHTICTQYAHIRWVRVHTNVPDWPLLGRPRGAVQDGLPRTGLRRSAAGARPFLTCSGGSCTELGNQQCVRGRRTRPRNALASAPLRTQSPQGYECSPSFCVYTDGATALHAQCRGTRWRAFAFRFHWPPWKQVGAWRGWVKMDIGSRKKRHSGVAIG
jgi:hypothetical protein